MLLTGIKVLFLLGIDLIAYCSAQVISYFDRYGYEPDYIESS